MTQHISATYVLISNYNSVHIKITKPKTGATYLELCSLTWYRGKHGVTKLRDSNYATVSNATERQIKTFTLRFKQQP